MPSAVLHRVRRQVELAEDAVHMRLDRGWRDKEQVRDPAVSPSFGEKGQDLSLPRTQGGE